MGSGVRSWWRRLVGLSGVVALLTLAASGVAAIPAGSPAAAAPAASIIGYSYDGRYWLANPDGSGARIAYQPPTDGKMHFSVGESLSTDGSMLAVSDVALTIEIVDNFPEYKIAENPTTVVVATDGSWTRLLPATDGWVPWSAAWDGHVLYVTEVEMALLDGGDEEEEEEEEEEELPPHQVVRYDLDASAPVRQIVSADLSKPRPGGLVSPDGRWTPVSGPRTGQGMDPDGGLFVQRIGPGHRDRHLIRKAPVQQAYDYAISAWSPDGRRIASVRANYSSTKFPPRMPPEPMGR